MTFQSLCDNADMLEEIRKLVDAAPFEPFVIQLSSGRSVRVPTADHILVTKKGVIGVEDDEGLIDIMTVLHVVGVTTASPSGAS